MPKKYQGFGLIIESIIELPELTEVQSEHEKADVKIIVDTFESLPRSEVLISNKFFEKNENQVIFSLENGCSFLIECGNTIKINQKNKNISESEIRLYLLGTCIGIILQQRGILCLHASAVIINQKAILFTGESGTGKSTTLSYFYKKGFSIIGDDVLPIIWEENQPYVVSAAPNIKLWQNSIIAIQLEDDQRLMRLRPDMSKYRLLLHDDFEHTYYPIDRCIGLYWSSKDKITAEVVPTNDAVFAYRQNTYRKAFLNYPNEQKFLFTHAINLAKSVPFYAFSRNKDKHNIFTFLDNLYKHLEI